MLPHRRVHAEGLLYYVMARGNAWAENFPQAK